MANKKPDHMGLQHLPSVIDDVLVSKQNQCLYHVFAQIRIEHLIVLLKQFNHLTWEFSSSLRKALRDLRYEVDQVAEIFCLVVWLQLEDGETCFIMAVLLLELSFIRFRISLQEILKLWNVGRQQS